MNTIICNIYNHIGDICNNRFMFYLAIWSKWLIISKTQHVKLLDPIVTSSYFCNLNKSLKYGRMTATICPLLWYCQEMIFPIYISAKSPKLFAVAAAIENQVGEFMEVVLGHITNGLLIPFQSMWLQTGCHSRNYWEII